MMTPVASAPQRALIEACLNSGVPFYWGAGHALDEIRLAVGRLDCQGNEYRLTFCEPTYLAARAERDLSATGTFFEPNLVVVPEVTADRLISATRRLIDTGDITRMAPAVPPTRWRDAGDVGWAWLHSQFAGTPAGFGESLISLSKTGKPWVQATTSDLDQPQPADLATSRNLAIGPAPNRLNIWLHSLPATATLVILDDPDDNGTNPYPSAFLEDHPISWRHPTDLTGRPAPDQPFRALVVDTQPEDLLEDHTSRQLTPNLTAVLAGAAIAAITTVHQGEAFLVATSDRYAPTTDQSGRPADGEITDTLELSGPAEHWTIPLRDGNTFQVLTHGYSIQGDDAQFELLFAATPNWIVPTLRIPLALLPDDFH